MAELKPCPFCGGEADFESHLGDDNILWDYVVCQQCFAQTDGCETEEHAEIAWNMRYTPPTQIDFDYEAEDE